MHKLVCPSVSERWNWMIDLWCLCKLILIFYGDVSFKCLNIYFSMPDCLVWMIDYCGIYICLHKHVHHSLYTGIFWIRINYWIELNWWGLHITRGFLENLDISRANIARCYNVSSFCFRFRNDTIIYRECIVNYCLTGASRLTSVFIGD